MSETIDKELFDDINYGTNIITGKEYLDTVITIADVASNMVSKTLGPYGKTTIIDDGSFTYPTKDGWSVLKRLRFNDPIFNTLYRVLQQVSFDLVSKVGDGTTSSFIGATVFMHKIRDYAKNNDFRQADFLKVLNEVVEDVIDALENSKYVKKIDVNGDFDDIYRIASVASNGNIELSEMIQKIYKETQNPNIYVELDKGYKLTTEIQTGYKFDCAAVNQKAYRNTDDGTFKLSERSMIAFFDHNVNFNEHEKIISGLSRYASAHNCTVFIMAPFFDDVLLNIIGTSINSMLQQGQVPNIMLIQVPLSHSIHREYLKDMVMLTNAQLIDYGKVRAFNVLVHNQTAKPDDVMEDALLNTDQYHFETPQDIIDMCIGKINNITVGEKYIMLSDFESIVNQTLYTNTLEEVRNTFVNMKDKMNKSTNNLQREFMDAYQHYVKLYGKMGIIHVGGASELEKHCLKDSVDDAVLACRSAYDNGYIRGLNLAMMNVIDSLFTEDMEQTRHDILSMLKDTFFEMSMTVLRNKYEDDVKRDAFTPNGSALLNNEGILKTALSHEYGYDLVTETFMTDDNCEVINSVSTDVEILRGMVSILSTMLTSNQFLSINRNFDRTVGRQQQRDEKIALQKDMASAITNAVLDVLSDRRDMNLKELQNLASDMTE